MRKISVRSLVITLYIALIMVFLYFRSFSIVARWGNINVFFLALSLLLFGAFVLLNLKGIRFYPQDLALLVFCLYTVINGVFFTLHTREAFEYWSILLAVFAFKIALQQQNKTVFQYNMALHGCGLLAAGVILLQFVMPGVVSAFQRLLLTQNAYQEAVNSYNLGYCTGITPFSASAVWYCGILFSFVFAAYLCQKKATFSSIAKCGLAVLAMIATQKRSVLLACLITVYLFYFLFAPKQNTRLFRIMLITGILLLLLVIAYQFIPQVQYMVYKTMRPGNALSGREALWSDMRPLFEQNPVFGSGGGTCQYMFGYGGHNCYLQMLAEYGYVGLTLFLMAFVVSFFSALYRTGIFLRTRRETKEAVWLLTALFLQAVFLIYCATGNPLFDSIFIMSQMACMGITSHILRDIRLVRIKWG